VTRGAQPVNSLAITLVLASCATHATWNLLSKRSSKTPGFFWIANAAVVVAAAPVFLWLGGVDVILNAPADLWLCLAATGACQAAYFVFLAAAYRHGDISFVYPLARTFPIFVVVVAGMWFGQWPTLLAYVGISLVVGGCFVLPLKRLRIGPDGFTLHSYLNRASIWALLTALASSGYTIADYKGMEIMTAAFAGASDQKLALLYGYLEWVATMPLLLLVVMFLGGFAGLKRVWSAERNTSLLVGALVFVTYMLILWAYTQSEKVAYVAGFRQLSIVLGVIAGVLFLKEPGGRARIVASVVIVVGLILIGLAR
jgi:drug/metabolite transporter (DMT)-like permease